MKGIKQGFVKIGEECYVREDAIAAVVFQPENSHGDASGVVYLQGAEPIEFSEERDINQLRDYVTKLHPRDIGIGPKG